jgi:hypothetical protein
MGGAERASRGDLSVYTTEWSGGGILTEANTHFRTPDSIVPGSRRLRSFRIPIHTSKLARYNSSSVSLLPRRGRATLRKTSTSITYGMSCLYWSNLTDANSRALAPPCVDYSSSTLDSNIECAEIAKRCTSSSRLRRIELLKAGRARSAHRMRMVVDVSCVSARARTEFDRRGAG